METIDETGPGARALTAGTDPGKRGREERSR